MKFGLLLVFFIFAIIDVGCGAVPPCEDYLMTDVCQHYSAWGKCHLFRAISLCRKSCSICGPGWSAWTSWGTCSATCRGEQTRTRFCKTAASDCPGDDVEKQECSAHDFACDSLVTTAPDLRTTKSVAELRCNDTHFLCDKLLYICIPLDLVCDGYNDCATGLDEKPTSCFAGKYDDAFQIKNELKQSCIEVITDDGLGPLNSVRGYRRCPSELNPLWKRFQWRWWKSFHLINIDTGRCLQAADPTTSTVPKLRSEYCDGGQTNQKWVCEEYEGKKFLVRLRKITKTDMNRYIGMEDDGDGWPLILTKNRTRLTSLWQRGPQEPPATICLKQVYWTEWGPWSECSKTCVGGVTTRTRSCVGGRDGDYPCIGGANELEPCNGNRPCITFGQVVQNSDCPYGWVTLKNARRLASPKSLDPSCYKLFTSPISSYVQAKAACKELRSFLASDKEELSNEFLVELMTNQSVAKLTYIGVEEDFSLPPIQTHHLRYHMDTTPVGSHKPWKVDCMLGAGYDYDGEISETASGLECQPWNVETPHQVKFVPVGSTNHNHCRNPDFDPSGPWCYTMSKNITKEHCVIPRCLQTIDVKSLSPSSEFQLYNPCIGYDGTTGVEQSIVVANMGASAPGVGVTSMTLSSLGCSRVKPVDWTKVGMESKFVWDITRTRILNVRYLLCMEASAIQPGARVTMETCDASKVTQRWKAEGGVISLINNNFYTDLHLDVVERSLILSSTEVGSWFVTRSRGHVVDWAALRKLPEDDSFQLYDIDEGKCASVQSSFPPSRRAADSSFVVATVAMVMCRASWSMRWMKYMSTRSNLMHLQTSLCLAADHLVAGARVGMRPCRSGDDKQNFGCQADLKISIGPLFLATRGTNMTLVADESLASRWRIWGSKNRTVCSVQIPRGNVATGVLFSIRNIHNKKCLQTDEVGAVYMEPCLMLGNNTHEIWRFTESPTMIMNYKTRTCLAAYRGRTGSLLSTQPCNIWSGTQHWTIFGKKSSFYETGKRNIFYSLHLLQHLSLSMEIQTTDDRVVLRDHTTNYWMAFNKFFAKSSLETMQECVINNKGHYYYNGNTTTSYYGRTCLYWSLSEEPTHRDIDGNSCRNPGDSTKYPWCYVFNGQIIDKEICMVPECLMAKVAVDVEGKWNAVSGVDELSYICQAEPECYRGVGVDYIGGWNITMGGVCKAWDDHIDENVAEHNYCRNPTSSIHGPWCYIDEASTARLTCPIPKCHLTCVGVPISLFHTEAVKHEYSATVHGFEFRSRVTTQCHRGYWVSRGTTRHTSDCLHGVWRPDPAACKVVSCSTVGFTVGHASLVTSTSSIFGQTSVYRCNGERLAGPGKLSVKYRCNEFGGWDKDRNQESSCTLPCDEGWKQFRQYCHKINETKLNFDKALTACRQNNATLADLEDKVDFEFLKQLVVDAGVEYGSDTLYWVGVKHFPKEPLPKDPTWRDYRSINIDNEVDLEQNKGANYLPFLRTSFYVMHHMHNRFTKKFDDILAYNLRCMFVEPKHKFVASRGCYDYPKRKMLWRWVTPYHLFNEAQELCLTGEEMTGDTKDDIKKPVTVTKCDTSNMNQYIGCRRHNHASLKLLLKDESYFVDDVTEPWDKIQMGGRYYGGNFSIWVLNETLLDVCHHTMAITGNAFLLWEGIEAVGKSYTYSEAESKCEGVGAKLATEEQLRDKMESDDISSCACAWGDGNVAYSVMRTKDPLCARSSPNGGVKRCDPTPSKADAWCYKGEDRDTLNIPWAAALWLDNSTREGLQERSSEDATKFICRKESRWHCARPPDLYRAVLKENIHSSYSYLGSTMYQCDTGYWFKRGLFAQTITCNADLMWEPDPEMLECTLLDCLPPSEIVNGRLTYGSLDYGQRANYRCNHGFWLAHSWFTIDVICGDFAYWTPSPGGLKCLPVQCNPPHRVEFSHLDIHTHAYPNNATLTCNPGYWLEPGVITMDITCTADGVWRPDPYYIRCWEVVCMPPSDQTHAVWRHINEKRTVMSCDHGYQFQQIAGGNVTHQVELECNLQGQWVPDISEYICEEIVCSLPPPSVGTDNTADVTIESYEHDSDVTYTCHLGSYLRYIFAPYSTFYERCLVKGTDGLIYMTENSCGTSETIYLQWGQGVTAGGQEDNVEGQEVNDGGQEVNVGGQLIEPRSGECLSVQGIPVRAASVKPLVLMPCNASDIRQYWLCNKHSVSDLILGMRGTIDYYITLNHNNGLIHTSQNKLDGLEFVSYDDRSNPVELDVCRFQNRHFSQKVSCLRSAGWIPDPSLIHCDVIMCPEPPGLKNAKMKASGEYSYGSVIRYDCNIGHEYLRGRSSFESRCSDEGTWVPDPGEFPCMRVKCPKYELPPGALVLAGDSKKRTFGSEMVVGCRVGWLFNGTSGAYRVKCREYKEWSPNHLVGPCMMLECPPPPQINNSTITVGNGSRGYKTVVRYTCNKGYWFNKGVVSMDARCSNSSTWIPSPASIRCKRVVCPNPGEIPNTIRYDIAKELTSGAIVMYKCIVGRWFVEGLRKVSIRCHDNGHWYPDPATLYCSEIRCLPPTLPHNSFLIGDDFNFGSKVIVSCDPGFRVGGHDPALTNQTTITCNKKRVWQPQPNLIGCFRVGCGTPPSVEHAHRVESYDFYGSYAQYICGVGYWVQPGAHMGYIQCMEDGGWGNVNFTCKALTCGHPGYFHHARAIYATGHGYGSIATLRCNEGYHVNGLPSVTIRCSRRGLWEPPPEELQCIITTCEDPGWVENTKRTIIHPNTTTPTTSPPIIMNTTYNYSNATNGTSINGTRSNRTELGTHEVETHIFGTRVLYECDHALQFAPKQSSIMTSCINGRWNIDVNKARCHDVTCDPPPPVEHGRITTTGGFGVNSTVTYNCDEGYWFRRDHWSMTLTCLASGDWDIEIKYIACIRITCHEAYPTHFGYFVNRGAMYTDTTRYYCNRGFRVNGESLAICNHRGQWEPHNITCERIYCNTPPTLVNAYQNSKTRREYNTDILFFCNPDHFFDFSLPYMVTKCLDEGWSNTDRECIHKSKLRCHHPSDPHAHLTFTPDNRVFVYCDMGFGIFDAGGSLYAKPEVTCSPNAQYRPIGFPSITCQVVQCNSPVVNGPHTVMSSQWYHSYATIVDVRCDDGYNFSPLDGTQRSPLIMSYTCNGVGEWVPDPTGFTCQRIDCGEPPSIMGLMMSYNATNLNDEVIYRCHGNKSFGESEVLTSVCSTNGKWSPDPRTRTCGYHKCSVPAPPPFATLSIERYGNTGGLQELRITCDEGYKILNSSQTISIMCDKTGQWRRSITEYPCEVVRCNPPRVPLMAIHPPLEELYAYNDIITFTCTPGKWFVPGASFTLAVRCSHNGWFPNINYTCADVYCAPPPTLHHATLSYDGLKVGSDTTYECVAGYWMQRGVTKRTTSCHGNAGWNPHPLGGNMECKAITCETPPHVNGSRIISNITQYKVGINVTYQCNDGKWFGKGEVARDVTCVQGSWQPSPHAIIMCKVIHCDALPPVEGARVDGYGTKVGSNVTYTCVHGKHFREYKLRRLAVICGREGGWIPQPENLKCYDVFCEILSVGGASKTHENREIGSSVELTCPHTTWFTRGEGSMIVTCNEDGRWLPHVGGVSCKVVDCGIPNINNIIPSHNYSYTSEVTIQCQHGYNIDPPGHASVVCDESGDWFPSPRHYRCIPVSCDLPRYIRHATVAGATTFNNTLIVTCDPGFHIRAGVNKVRSRCLADRTWDVNLNTIDCKSFTCKDPGYVTRSTRESLSAHLMHGAMYKFVCEHGYWVDGLYSIVVVCSLAGAWEPAVNFTCTEIRCLHPPMKVKSTLIINGGENRTDYAIDQTMRYECDDHSWLTAQYEVTEWTFTGLSDVTMTCKVTGQWYPHPDSFACRDITEGSVPVGYPRGLPGKKVFFGYWKRPLGGSNHTYSVAVSTGLLTWHGGPTMTSSIVKSQSASDIGYEVSKLWDGDAATSWRPVVTENRHYNVTIYLGGLYIVKGVEFSSNENEGSMVAALRLTFSDDGKSFNRSLELSMREGRSNNRPISIENQPGRLRFSGFEDVAKFVQITILSTMDGSAPTIGEVRFLSMTSQWSIVIPIDDITIPVILSCTLVCMFIMMVWAVRRDANDRGAIHFVMNEVTMDTDIVMIQIKLVQSRPPVQFLCRLLGEDTTSFIVEHRVATNTMLVVVPVQRFQGLRFQLCIVPGESPAIDVSIKIGMLSIDDVIEGNVSWLFVKQSRLSPGVPQSYKFDKVGEKRRVTMARIESLGRVSKYFHSILPNHLLYSTFVNDFLRQITRSEKIFLVFFGLFVSLCCATMLEYMTSQCWLSAVVTMATTPMMFVISIVLMKYPIYVGESLKSLSPLGGVEEILQKFDDVVSTVGIPPSRSSSDSWLLPWKLRFQHRVATEDDILTRDLDAGFILRNHRLPRRTRSAPAIMMSPPDDVSMTSVSELSCAHMWSRKWMVDDWHRVHRSMKDSIERLFEQCDDDSVSMFSWADAEYRRVPSRISDRGYVTRPTEVPDWLESELDRRKKEAIMTSSHTQYPTWHRINVPLKSTSTQKPSNIRLGDSPSHDDVTPLLRNRQHSDAILPSAGAALPHSDYDVTSIITQQTLDDKPSMMSYKEVDSYVDNDDCDITSGVTMAMTAKDFYKMPRERIITKWIVLFIMVVCVVIIALFGIRTLDQTSQILCIVYVTIPCFLFVTLTLDALLRHNDDDHVTLKTFFSMPLPSGSASPSNSG